MRIGGIKVVDATRPLPVRVTKLDCTKGDNKNPGSCAAARALLREPGCVEARVHLGRTYIKVTKGREQKWLRYNTPESIRGEIIAFDRGAQFTPGEYILRPMSPASRLGASTGSKAKHRTPAERAKAPKRRPPHVVQGVRHRGANR